VNYRVGPAGAVWGKTARKARQDQEGLFFFEKKNQKTFIH